MALFAFPEPERLAPLEDDSKLQPENCYIIDERTGRSVHLSSTLCDFVDERKAGKSGSSVTKPDAKYEAISKPEAKYEATFLLA